MRIARRLLLPSLPWCLLLAGCPGPAEDPCGHDGALSTCLEPGFEADYYVSMSSMYFDTMDVSVDLGGAWPPYAERVARWEWPPWLRLTAFGRDDLIAADTLLKLFPSEVPVRDCRAFDVQPFGRCHVVFQYEAHGWRDCPIYEEFTFNDAGEITWIEAWSDLDGYRPAPADDPWAEGEATRLSTRIPGLGNAEGRVALDSAWMDAAAAADPDVADFVARAEDWHAAWLEALEEAGEEMWDVGCGW